MKDAILHELARRWDQEAIQPEAEDGSEEARVSNAKTRGEREAKRECADTLRTLIDMLGDSPLRSNTGINRSREAASG